MRFNYLIKSLITLLICIIPVLSFDLYASAGSDIKQSNSENNTVVQVRRVVWGAPESPFVRKILVVLEEKNLPYTIKEILPEKVMNKLGQKVPVEFIKISPLGKIPAFEENDGSSRFSISDSNVIANYLEQKYPEPALRPLTIESNAWVSWFMNYADEILAPNCQNVLRERVIKVKVFKENSDEKVVKNILAKELPSILDFLEKTLQDRVWIAGTDNISLADIAIVSQFGSLKLSSVNVDDLIGKKRPKLLAYVHKVLERKSFQKVNAMAGF